MTVGNGDGGGEGGSGGGPRHLGHLPSAQERRRRGGNFNKLAVEVAPRGLQHPSYNL